MVLVQCMSVLQCPDERMMFHAVLLDTSGHLWMAKYTDKGDIVLDWMKFDKIPGKLIQ